MNKAFVREPDDTGAGYCPRCGSLGTAVGRPTLAAHLRAEAVGQLSDPAFFCPFARCDVVYFDTFERTATTDVLVRPVYPKDPTAPLCGCFGLTREDVEQDVREGGVARVRAAGQIQIPASGLRDQIRQRPVLHARGAALFHEAARGSGRVTTPEARRRLR